MTLEQYGTIYAALNEANVSARVSKATADSEYTRKAADRLRFMTDEAFAELARAYDNSGMLRGKQPCPHCGEYINQEASR